MYHLQILKQNINLYDMVDKIVHSNALWPV